MSDSYVRLVPVDHLALPETAAMEEILQMARLRFQKADEIRVETSDEVRFIDCGENLESVNCNHCGSDQTEWFVEETGRAYEESQFRELSVTMPCCAKKATLNTLIFNWPCGFARISLDIINPNQDPLDASEIEAFSVAAGMPMRQILAHY